MFTVKSKIGRHMGLGLFAVICTYINVAAAADRGGLFVEPAVTFEKGDTSVNYPSPFSDSSGDSNGFGLGARVGFHLSDIIFLGMDGRYSRPKFKDSTANYDATANSYNWGPVAGIQMPIVGLRVWASYIAGSELDPAKDGALDVKFVSGSGYRVGAGMRVALVSLNLEYQHINYSRTELQQLGPFTTTSSFDNVELNNNAWIASVSFPLAL